MEIILLNGRDSVIVISIPTPVTISACRNERREGGRRERGRKEDIDEMERKIIQPKMEEYLDVAPFIFMIQVRGHSKKKSLLKLPCCVFPVSCFMLALCIPF